MTEPTLQPAPQPATQPVPQSVAQPASQPVSQPMKVLIALNVITLVAVLLLGGFVAIKVADTSTQVSTIAAAVPESGIASSSDVKGLAMTTESVAQAVNSLSSQVTALQADIIAMRTQVAGIAASTGSSPGPAASPDGAIANIMSKLEQLQGVVTHLQEDLAAVNGLVQTVCKALGRC
jgi:hypothetical protein